MGKRQRSTPKITFIDTRECHREYWRSDIGDEMKIYTKDNINRHEGMSKRALEGQILWKR